METVQDILNELYSLGSKPTERCPLTIDEVADLIVRTKIAVFEDQDTVESAAKMHRDDMDFRQYVYVVYDDIGNCILDCSVDGLETEWEDYATYPVYRAYVLGDPIAEIREDGSWYV